MKNVQTKVEGNTLTITVDLSKEFGPSKSLKTIVIASSEGNHKVEGTETYLGINIYKYPPR